MAPADAARRRIAGALAGDPGTIALAAAYADTFHVDVAALADDLEHPQPEMLGVTKERPTSSALLAATAVRHGQECQEEGDLAEAERRYRWAGEQFHALGIPEGESLAVTLLGRAIEMQDRLEEVERFYHRALELDRAIGDAWNESVDLGLLGQVAWLRGNLDEAERHARNALAMQWQAKDTRNGATTLASLGHVAHERGQRWRALAYTLRSAVAKRGILLG